MSANTFNAKRSYRDGLALLSGGDVTDEAINRSIDAAAAAQAALAVERSVTHVG